jgi:non-specific serine/threonine protein kinase/serine/threonine-protein kinase
MPPLDPDRWQAASPYLDEALELSEDERAAWLKALRARDPALAADVETLLGEHDTLERGDFLEGGPTLPPNPASLAGETIGPYRLLQRIGEGGMGEVWLAEQTSPVRRQVALKLIKQGMDTRQVIARFEAERQALALMDHPCVAKVFEAGSTPQGKPYFAMEYVRGLAITEYCDRHRLSTRERLELFVLLCEGVQHAHQKAIIHRDLKPSNVLVVEQDGRRLPKVIDFGVAKATAQRLTEKSMFTELGVLIGTPEYMSPEQAELTGEDVDTRTDVYSLGVILYEMLVGALPFDSKDLRSGGFEGIRRMIREQEPKRPSTRFATLGDRSGESARRRRTDTSTLLRQLRGDLDWITMKALEKDRARRYGSPMELAADVARHLGDEAVQARPPSTAYRARKFVRRHRLGVATASLVSAALIVAVVGTGVGLVRARRAEAAAKDEQARAEKVAKFLSGMLEGMDPITMGGTVRTEIVDQLAAEEKRQGHVAAGGPPAAPLEGVNTVDVARQLVDGEILQKAARRVESEVGDDPVLAAKLYHTISSAEHSLQLYERERETLSRAIGESTRAHGAEDRFTLHLQNDLASADRRAGRYGEAEAVYIQVIVTARRALGEEARETLSAMNYLGDTYRFEGRTAEAEPLLRETLEKTRRVLGEDDIETLQTSNNLALVLRDERRYAEAETLLRDTSEKMKRVPLDPGESLVSPGNLADVLQLSGRLEEAESLLVELHASGGRVLGEDAFLTLWIRRILADVYFAQQRYDEAETLMRDTLGRMRRAIGAEHSETLAQIHALARLLAKRGRNSEAEQLLLKLLSDYKRVQGDRALQTLLTSNDLGSLYEEQGRWGEAGALYAKSAHALEEAHPVPLDAVYADAAFHLACYAARRNDRSAAMTWLGKAVDAGLPTPERIAASPDLARLHGPELDALAVRALTARPPSL